MVECTQQWEGPPFERDWKRVNMLPSKGRGEKS